MVVLFLMFGGTSIQFSIMAELITFDQQCIIVLFSSHPFQHLSFLFLIIPFHTDVKQYLIEILICISMLVSDIEHLFMYLFFFSFLGQHLWHKEFPRLGVELEMKLPAYATATATWDLSHIYDLDTACSNTRSLTHWERAGIEPTSSWTLVGFLTHWATTELLMFCIRLSVCLWKNINSNPLPGF